MSTLSKLGLTVGAIIMVVVEFTREGYRWLVRP